MKKAYIFICFIFTLFLVGFSQSSDDVRGDIEENYKKNQYLDEYIKARMTYLQKIVKNNESFTRFGEEFKKIALLSIELIKKPLQRFEAVNNVIDGDRFLSQEYIYKNKDYEWQKNICDEYIAASNNILNITYLFI